MPDSKVRTMTCTTCSVFSCPYDEIGIVLMQQHLASEHDIHIELPANLIPRG